MFDWSDYDVYELKEALTRESIQKLFQIWENP